MRFLCSSLFIECNLTAVVKERNMKDETEEMYENRSGFKTPPLIG
jgi:hypothetical protein